MTWLFPDRIARVSYLLRSSIAAIAIEAWRATAAPTGAGINGFAALLPLLGLGLYWGIAIVAPRCRDLGYSGWWAMLVLVPGPNFLLGGLLTWKRSAPDPAGLCLADPVVASEPPAGVSRPVPAPSKSESLRRLEALRDEGVLTEQDFLRRKARLDAPRGSP
jgi:hypothetical protein